MKRIAITQNIVFQQDRNEYRDSLDIRWWNLFQKLSFIPIILPNHPDLASRVLSTESIDGVILTGGNDILSVGGTYPQRDELEISLLKMCESKGQPLLGVCRGMQLMLDKEGTKPEKITGHAGTRHKVLFLSDGKQIEVNSYHNFGFSSVNEKFETLAKAQDGTIELVKHKSARIFGMMWHPERETTVSEFDQNFIKSIFY